MNAREAAERLKISYSTIHSYIKEGLLVPDNPITWQIEGEYRIPDQQVEDLYQKLYPGGLTTNEAATYVGCKQFHILQAINKNRLTVQKSEIETRTQYFVVKDEKLETYKREFSTKKQKKKPHYHTPMKLFMYQLHKHKETGDVARVMNLDIDEGYAQNNLGENIPLHELAAHYTPLTSFHLGKASNRKGQITFVFAKPTHIHSLTYTFIETLAEQTGLKYFSVETKENQLIVNCKPFILAFPDGVNEELIEHAKRGLTNGEVSQQKNEFLFLSTDRVITLNVNADQYKQLEYKAKKWGISVEEYITTNFDLIL